MSKLQSIRRKDQSQVFFVYMNEELVSAAGLQKGDLVFVSCPARGQIVLTKQEGGGN